MRLLRENRVPSEPRFTFVTEKAYDFLLEYGYDHFPISPFQVLDDLSDFVTCLPWSDAKKILKSPDPFHGRGRGRPERAGEDRGQGAAFAENVQSGLKNSIKQQGALRTAERRFFIVEKSVDSLDLLSSL